MTWIRLRQVALVARDLEPVVEDLRDAFGLEVAYRDPGVDYYEQRYRQRLLNSLQKKAANLGFQLTPLQEVH